MSSRLAAQPPAGDLAKPVCVVFTVLTRVPFSLSVLILKHYSLDKLFPRQVLLVRLGKGALTRAILSVLVAAVLSLGATLTSYALSNRPPFPPISIRTR